MKLIPTILCGGAGSRLWPVSRELHPKPFIRLADGQSLLQKAWLRGAVLPDVAETLTVTNRELFFKTEDEYREVAAIPTNQDLTNRFILEPFGRNTAPAIAAAALQVAATHGEDACLLVLAADHLIADQAAFAQAVATAMQLAAQGKLVTFGIQPDTPETGYGYIEADLDSPLPLAGRSERGGEAGYARLKAEGHEAHRLHRTVHRPWDTYTVLEEGSHFKIKRIEVKNTVLPRCFPPRLGLS